MKIDENFNWKQNIHDTAIKLSSANALLYTIRIFVNRHILRINYFAIFDTHLNYANPIWGQNLIAMSRIVILQKKVLRIRNFQSRNSHSGPSFTSKHILKLEDKILIENVLFTNKSLNNLLPPIFKNWFTFCSECSQFSNSLIYLPLIKYLNHHIEPILSGKIRSL